MTAALHYRCGAPALLVMLPGALMTPQQMVDAGLFAAVQARRRELDVMLPDLHAQSGNDQDALRALETQCLAPARRGYEHIWLGGISRGGHLALSYLANSNSPVHGVCLLAPYPGSRITQNTIARAGGMHRWQATPAQLHDPEFRVWQWLQNPTWPAHVFMGYGADDRFADGMQLLASHMQGGAVQIVPGGHGWMAWSHLWARFLDSCFGTPA